MSPSKANLNPRLVQLARGIGMKGYRDPVSYLVNYCLRKVGGWVEEFAPKTLDELLATAVAKVGLILEYVWSDGDLTGITSRYLQEGEGGFARVRREFDDRTFALVLRLRKPRNGCTHVAVIDCRGPKEQRKWFSVWHEIAHLLVQPQLSFDFRRTVAGDKDPIETAMDAIAGELAFYRPMFSAKTAEETTISFATLEAHRLETAPQASLESAYATTIERSAIPALFVVAKMSLKPSEHREKLSNILFSGATPTPKLRAVRVARSSSALPTGLFIPRYFQVPERSVIARIFHGELALAKRVHKERQGWWKSQGEPRPDLPILVEAALFGSRAFAIITLVTRK